MTDILDTIDDTPVPTIDLAGLADRLGFRLSEWQRLLLENLPTGRMVVDFDRDFTRRRYDGLNWDKLWEKLMAEASATLATRRTRLRRMRHLYRQRRRKW